MEKEEKGLSTSSSSLTREALEGSRHTLHNTTWHSRQLLLTTGVRGGCWQYCQALAHLSFILAAVTLFSLPSSLLTSLHSPPPPSPPVNR